MRRILGTLGVLAHALGQARAPFRRPDHIARVRDARIRRIVAHAAATVPFYRDWFTHERLDPREIRTAADLSRLPMLERDIVRRDPKRFLSKSAYAIGALPLLTSGSTGTPLEIHHDRRSVLANIAFGERERAPVVALCGTFRPKELYIGYDTSNFRTILRFYADHTRLPIRPRRDSASMTMPVEKVVEAINRLRPDVLTAYGGFLDTLYRNVINLGLDLHRPRVVMYMGEALPLDRQRWIEKEVGATVLSRYNAVEAFKIGYFCGAGTGFHLHDDLCHVRIRTTEGRDAAAGEPGEVVISNLVNYATVLLNYPMGDIAALSGHACTCGRQHRLLTTLEGRLEDSLTLPDGRELHPRAIWAAFKDDRDVLQYQLVQQDVTRFDLALVTVDEARFATASARAVAALRALLGDGVQIEVARRAELEQPARAARGKFRAVESEVTRR